MPPEKVYMKKFYKNYVRGLVLALTIFFYDKLGFRYIWEKFYPPYNKQEERPPSTFILGLISVCMGLFTLASLRYESALNRLVNNVHLVVYQIDAENWKSIVKELPKLQNTKIPYEPSIINPLSSLKSLLPFYDAIDSQTIRTLEGVISRKKRDLSHVYLRKLIITPGHVVVREELRYEGIVSINIEYGEFEKSNFSFADLTEASLEHNSFASSNFKGSILVNSNMQKCNLTDVNLDNATLFHSDLRNSNLAGAKMKNVILSKSNLESANLCGVDLTQTFGIETANLNKAFYTSKLIDLNFIPNPDEIKKFLLKKKLDESLAEEIYSALLSCSISKTFTKFPSDFLPAEHGMFDLYEIVKYHEVGLIAPP